jgi:hypothetical protein
MIRINLFVLFVEEDPYPTRIEAVSRHFFPRMDTSIHKEINSFLKSMKDKLDLDIL